MAGVEKEAGSLSRMDRVCPARARSLPFAPYTCYLVERKDSLPATHEITVQLYLRNTHALFSSALVPFLLFLKVHLLGAEGLFHRQGMCAKGL